MIGLAIMVYINNSLHLARNYAWIFVRGHYLFREANSFPRAKLEDNCELREWKEKKLTFTVMRSRSRENLKFGHFTLFGSLSNEDGDGNENATKQKVNE